MLAGPFSQFCCRLHSKCVQWFVLLSGLGVRASDPWEARSGGQPHQQYFDCQPIPGTLRNKVPHILLQRILQSVLERNILFEKMILNLSPEVRERKLKEITTLNVPRVGLAGDEVHLNLPLGE